jgi:hypothetical protein
MHEAFNTVTMSDSHVMKQLPHYDPNCNNYGKGSLCMCLLFLFESLESSVHA